MIAFYIYNIINILHRLNILLVCSKLSKNIINSIDNEYLMSYMSKNSIILEFKEQILRILSCWSHINE